MKIVLFPVLLAFACLLAGLYGAVHNQISYTIAPGYFHELKFNQFRISPDLHNRLGAGLVGVKASWWMGMLIGFPVYVAALFVKGTGAFIGTFCRAAVYVVTVTLTVGLLALFGSYFVISLDTLPDWMQRYNVSDPLAFARAGTMHNYSYTGGLMGLIFGLVYTVKSARRSRRTPKI